MRNQIAIASSAVSADLANCAVLEILADAWNRYPSEALLPRAGTDDQELLGQVLRLLAQEGVVRTTDKFIALTDRGYAAVQQACRADCRVSEYLQDGLLPAGEAGSSFLVLAILRARFEQRNSEATADEQ